MHHPILLFLTFCLSVQRFQMPLEGLHFVKTLETFGIITATETLRQDITAIVWLR